MKNRMQMVAVKGGEFVMGSDLIGPIRGVKVSNYKIGKFQVTNAQYEEVMGKHKGMFSGIDLPVERVSWFDAVEFCNKLSEIEGFEKCYSIEGKVVKCNFRKNGYRLPTEAEWEYAAKGGKEQWEYPYSGSMKLDETGWYNSNTENKIHNAGEKKPNSLGLFDMSGNVFEWCWDIFDYYKPETKTLNNPKGPSKKGFRVIKGGSFMHGSEYSLVAARIGSPDIAIHGWLGFRVVRKGF